MQVTQENVLAVRKTLLAEAVQLDGLLSLHSRTLRVRAPAGDPVSGPAAELLNEKLEGLKVQFQTHVNALKAAGNALTVTAQAYGYTEEQIKASFDPENPLCEAEGGLS